MAKFLTLTDKCNCYCTFCYEISTEGEPHTYEATMDRLALEMRQAMEDEGWKDIVITGGEPTIMPTFLPSITRAREMGYQMIAVATNGRRFAYAPFAKKAAERGLNRAWVSLFGHNARVHDATTRTPNSFVETTEGIRNLQAAGVPVTCSVVVNKLNHRLLPDYFDFVQTLGVQSVSVMGLKPFGGAFLNQKAVFYDRDEGAPYVNAGIRYGVSKGFEIKTMGLPAPHFDTTGTRDDNNRALKYFDYVLKRLGGDPYCQGELCDTCFGRPVCPVSAPEGELLICKCKAVQEQTIRAAVREGDLSTVDEVSAATRACTGCGTCHVDVSLLIRSERQGTPFEPSREFHPASTRHGASLESGDEWEEKQSGGSKRRSLPLVTPPEAVL